MSIFIEKLKFGLFRRYSYPKIVQGLVEQVITPTKEAVLFYNPYEDVLIDYFNEIENYTVVSCMDNVDVSKYEKIIICVYFFNHRIKRMNVSPRDLVNNESDFDTQDKKIPILNNDIKELLGQDNCMLLLFTPWELVPTTPFMIYSINRLIKKYPLLTKKIILSSSDFLKSNRLVSHDKFMTVSYNWSLLVAKYNFSKETFKRNNNTKKGKRIIILNRRHNSERFICACYFRTNYKALCHISYLMKPASTIESVYYDKAAANAFYEELPIKLDGGYDGVAWHAFDGIGQFVQDAYVMVIFETNNNPREGHCQVSEKTFKGIMAGMPFLVFTSTPGILAYLKTMGFKSFSPMIDESYDQSMDYPTRYKRFLKAIESICNKTEEEIEELNNKCIPIVEHNLKVLTNSKASIFL